MRVVTLTTSFPRDAGDHAGRFVADLHAGLREEGHDVVTVCPGAPGVAATEEGEFGTVLRVPYASEQDMDLFYGDGVEQNVRTIRRAGSKLRAFMRAAEDVIRGSLETGADLLVGHWVWPSGRVCDRARGARRTPLLGVGHGADLHLLARPVVGRVLARPLRGRLAGALCTSEAGARVLSRRLGLAAERIRVRPMGVDPLRFGPGTTAPGGWPAGFVLGVGRLVPVKGFDLLVRACARIGRDLVLVGDGPERGRLEGIAGETGCRLHLPGRLPHASIPAAMATAAAVAVPSRVLAGGRAEGCPMVAVEALAAGVPLVASRSGGLPTVVPPEALFEPGDLAGLVAVLERALAAAPAPPRQVPERLTRRAAARDLLALVPVPGSRSGSG